MSDAEPARKDEADAPARPRNPWVSWLVWLILTLMLYVLSSGPVFWLAQKRYIPEQVWFIYFPLGFLPSGIHDLILRYWEWWLN